MVLVTHPGMVLVCSGATGDTQVPQRCCGVFGMPQEASAHTTGNRKSSMVYMAGESAPYVKGWLAGRLTPCVAPFFQWCWCGLCLPILCGAYSTGTPPCVRTQHRHSALPAVTTQAGHITIVRTEHRHAKYGSRGRGCAPVGTPACIMPGMGGGGCKAGWCLQAHGFPLHVVRGGWVSFGKEWCGG
jgi:hypothetical protein